MPLELPGSHPRATGLVDVLDRVLDKAQEIGLDWWRYDRDLSPGAARATLAEQESLRAEVRQLQERVDALTAKRRGSRRAR